MLKLVLLFLVSILFGTWGKPEKLEAKALGDLSEITSIQHILDHAAESQGAVPVLVAEAPVVKEKVEPGKQAVYVVDTFEDGDFQQNPEWWRFGLLNLKVIDNDKNEYRFLESKSLHLTGMTENWYVGGLGTYIGVDGSQFDAVKLVVKGSGKKSGVLKLELYDDDNQNWEVEQDSVKSIPQYDDRWAFNLNVDWTGWKVVIVPFSEFFDDNPLVGDDKFNVDQKDGSGGLLQMQIIALSATKRGAVDIKVDSIRLIKQGAPAPAAAPAAPAKG